MKWPSHLAIIFLYHIQLCFMLAKLLCLLTNHLPGGGGGGRGDILPSLLCMKRWGLYSSWWNRFWLQKVLESPFSWLCSSAKANWAIVEFTTIAPVVTSTLSALFLSLLRQGSPPSFFPEVLFVSSWVSSQFPIAWSCSYVLYHTVCAAHSKWLVELKCALNN